MRKLKMKETDSGKRITVGPRQGPQLFELQCCDPADWPEEDLGTDEIEWFVWSFALNGTIPEDAPLRTDIDALASALDWFNLTLDDVELLPRFTARLDALKAAIEEYK